MKIQRLLLNEPISKHSTLHIGGPAKYFLSAKTAEEIKNAVTGAREEDIPYVCIGGGSNILVSDAGFDGLIVKIATQDIQIDGTKIYADAGVFSAALSRRAAESGLSGIEWMVTLPGTVGGAIYGNAGAYGEEIKNKISRVKVLSADGKEMWLGKVDCHFAYRNSKFKSNKAIILGAELELVREDKEKIKQKMNQLLEKRKDEQPLGSSSAGCIFKNHETTGAGALIDRAGLKGLSVGGAQISNLHGNFSLNTGGASAEDLVNLIALVKMKVREKFGIELQEEIQYIGF